MSRIPQLLKMLEQQPADSFLKHALALEYIKEGKLQEAAEMFENLLAENPAYVGSYYHLGQVYELQQETEKAIRVYEKGMEMASAANDRHALNELRVVYEELKF